jgi:hypothetical protein
VDRPGSARGATRRAGRRRRPHGPRRGSHPARRRRRTARARPVRTGFACTWPGPARGRLRAVAPAVPARRPGQCPADLSRRARRPGRGGGSLRAQRGRPGHAEGARAASRTRPRTWQLLFHGLRPCDARHRRARGGQLPGRAGSRPVRMAVHARTAAAGIRRVAAPPAADRRFPRTVAGGQGCLRRPRHRCLGRARAPRTASLGRKQPPPRTRHDRSAHPAGAADHPAGRRRTVQQGNRSASLPVAPHRRITPVPGVSQARHHVAGAARERAARRSRAARYLAFNPPGTPAGPC